MKKFAVVKCTVGAIEHTCFLHSCRKRKPQYSGSNLVKSLFEYSGKFLIRPDSDIFLNDTGFIFAKQEIVFQSNSLEELIEKYFVELL